MIMDEWKKQQVSDRVMLSLVCKRFAEHLGVGRSSIPRPLAQGNFATTHRRGRLHFMLRLGPWFDDNAAQDNEVIQDTEKARAERHYKGMNEFAIVDKGWVLCTICLKYRRARITMLDLSLDTNHRTDTSDLCGRWMRCVSTVPQETEGDEDTWTVVPADKTKLPDFCNPKSRIRKAKQAASSSKGKGKGKDIVRPKEKMDTPQNSSSAAKGMSNAKALEKLTGLEECSYLPVDLEGEHIAQLCICPIHKFDPVKLMSL